MSVLLGDFTFPEGASSSALIVLASLCSLLSLAAGFLYLSLSSKIAVLERREALNYPLHTEKSDPRRLSRSPPEGTGGRSRRRVAYEDCPEIEEVSQRAERSYSAPESGEQGSGEEGEEEEERGLVKEYEMTDRERSWVLLADQVFSAFNEALEPIASAAEGRPSKEHYRALSASFSDVKALFGQIERDTQYNKAAEIRGYILVVNRFLDLEGLEVLRKCQLLADAPPSPSSSSGKVGGEARWLVEKLVPMIWS